ncbi:MAG: vitamin K epoxide reductase family protein, partial [Candidatus Nanopelagicales bacterium]
MIFSLPLKWLLFLGGLVGFWASMVLTVDKIRILEDPAYISNCDINSIFSCGEIVNTAQAAIFGFPNTLIGIASYSVLITLGVLLLAKISLPIWVLRGVVLGSGLAVIFVSYLAY